MLCSDLNGKEIQKRGDIRRRRADSLCCAEDTETTLSSSYTPIRINLKRKKEPSLARGSLRIPGASDGVEFPEVSLIWEVWDPSGLRMSLSFLCLSSLAAPPCSLPSSHTLSLLFLKHSRNNPPQGLFSSWPLLAGSSFRKLHGRLLHLLSVFAQMSPPQLAWPVYLKWCHVLFILDCFYFSFSTFSLSCLTF